MPDSQTPTDPGGAQPQPGQPALDPRAAAEVRYRLTWKSVSDHEVETTGAELAALLRCQPHEIDPQTAAGELDGDRLGELEDDGFIGTSAEEIEVALVAEPQQAGAPAQPSPAPGDHSPQSLLAPGLKRRLDAMAEFDVDGVDPEELRQWLIDVVRAPYGLPVEPVMNLAVPSPATGLPGQRALVYDLTGHGAGIVVAHEQATVGQVRRRPARGRLCGHRGGNAWHCRGAAEHLQGMTAEAASSSWMDPGQAGPDRRCGHTARSV